MNQRSSTAEIVETPPGARARRPAPMSLRRWIERHRLRWQARLDGAWADRVVPFAAAASLFVVFAALSLATVRSLEVPIDLASAVQGTWLIGQGQDPVVTIDAGEHVLARQAALVMYPIGLLGRVVPIEPMLLVIQAAALAAGVIPLWWIARRHASLRAGAAAALLFAYAFYPAIHNLNLAGFHPEVLALPGLLAVMYFGLAERWRPFAAFTVLVLLSRADLGLAIAGVGGMLAWRGQRRAGQITAAAGVGWTLLAIFVVQPLVGDGSTAHLAAFGTYGDTPWGVIWGMVTDPVQVLGDITRRVNFEVFVVLFAPVLFLPMLAPRYLVPILPLEFLYLVSEVPRQARFGQQTVAITAFIFLACAFALGGLGRRGVEKITVDGRLLGALVLSSSVFFVQFAASSPYREPWEWGSEDAADVARRDAVAVVPGDASVRASPTLLVLLAQRKSVEVVDQRARPEASALAAGVDAVVLDHDDHPWRSADWQALDRGLSELGFEKAEEDGTVIVWLRAP